MCKRTEAPRAYACSLDSAIITLSFCHCRQHVRAQIQRVPVSVCDSVSLFHLPYPPLPFSAVVCVCAAHLSDLARALMPWAHPRFCVRPNKAGYVVARLERATQSVSWLCPCCRIKVTGAATGGWARGDDVQRACASCSTETGCFCGAQDNSRMPKGGVDLY